MKQFGSTLVLALALATSSEGFQVAKVGFEELFGESVSQTLQDAVSTDGLFQVIDVPSLSLLRYKTMESAAACAAESSSNSEIFLLDGTIRKTFASAIENGNLAGMDLMADFSSEEAPESCRTFLKESSALRDLVTMVSNAVVDELDRHCGSLSVRGSPIAQRTDGSEYKTLREFVSKGKHLEHFHAYQANCDDTATRKNTIDMHTDEGLFIGVIPSLWVDTKRNRRINNMDPAHGFFIQTHDGKIVKPELSADGDVILFMMGDGAQTWFGTCAKKTRSVPHSLVLADACSLLDETGQPLRMWYGRMFLPPSDAIVESSGKSFIEHRSKLAHSVSNPDKTGVSMGCSGGRQLADEPAITCDKSAGQFLCWMKCRAWGNDTSCTTETPDELFLCSDPTTGAVWDGETHCFGCKLSCREPNSTMSPTDSKVDIDTKSPTSGSQSDYVISALFSVAAAFLFSHQ